MPADPTTVANTELPASPVLQRFDFGQTELLTSDQLRTLRSLDEALARNLTHTLSAWLRTNLTASAQPSQQRSYQEFLAASAGGYLLPIDLPGRHVRGVLCWPVQLACEFVDLLLGGSGGVERPDRELTEIEEAVLHSVLDVVLRDANAVWQTIGVSFLLGTREQDGQERQLMSLGERVLSFHFSLVTPNASGELAFCLPLSALNTWLRAFHSARKGTRQQSGEELARLTSLLAQARLHAGLCFPPVRVRASLLQAMEPGALLRLPLSANVRGELRMNEAAVHAAQPVRTGERRGAHIAAPADARLPLPPPRAI